MTFLTPFRLFVPGTPIPKGSTRAFVVKGKAVTTAANKDTKPWEATVAAFARDEIGSEIRYPQPVPVYVGLTFVMPRRTAEPKRETPPHTRKPDLDKLTRAVLDALTGLAYVDDAQVAEISATKYTAGQTQQPGVWITLLHHIHIEVVS